MRGVLCEKEPKGVSNFLRREESSKEASTLTKASPYMERMQPLLLSLLHFGILDPSKGRDVFIDYAGRWSIRRWSIKRWSIV